MLAKQHVDVEGQRLILSNLDKILYPDFEFTKGQVIITSGFRAGFSLISRIGRCRCCVFAMESVERDLLQMLIP